MRNLLARDTTRARGKLRSTRPISWENLNTSGVLEPDLGTFGYLPSCNGTDVSTCEEGQWGTVHVVRHENLAAWGEHHLLHDSLEKALMQVDARP